MSRRPLQAVNGNVLRPAFPIFDDFKAQPVKPKLVHQSVSSSQPTKPAISNVALKKVFIATIVAQQFEIRLQKKRIAFLKLVNYNLGRKIPAATTVPTSPKKPAVTPKKRRLEEESIESPEEIAVASRTSATATTTPARVRVSAGIVGTPQDGARRGLQTPQHAKASSATPARPPLADTTNSTAHTSAPPEHAHQHVHAKATARAVDSLTARLQQVEDCLQKLSTSNSHSSSGSQRTAETMYGSPRVEPPQRRRAAGPASPGASAASPSESAPANANTTANPDRPERTTSAPLYRGLQEDLPAPIFAEHQVLQAAMQRATRESMKTLMRGRDVLPGATEIRDAQAAYRTDTARLQGAFSAAAAVELSSSASRMAPEVQAQALEASIVNYHHTRPGAYPLAPLGDQSARSPTQPIVPLSELSLLQEKMQSWRTKYAVRAPPPADS